MEHKRVLVRRAARASCRSEDIYVAPKAASSINSGSTTLQWNTKCVTSGNVDIYLYAQQQQAAVRPIHAWLGLPAGQGSANVQLLPEWWNGTSKLPMNLQIVPSGGQAWETQYPMSKSFTVLSASGLPSGTENVTSPHVTDYSGSGQIGTGPLAAAIVVPIVVVLALFGATFVWLHKRKLKRHEQKVRTLASSQYSGSGTPAMSQAPSVPPMSVYNAYPYAPEPSQEPEYMQDQDMSVAAPAIPERVLELVPEKEANSSIGDLTGSQTADDSLTMNNSDHEEELDSMRNTSPSRLHYAGFTRPRRMADPDSLYDRPYGEPTAPSRRTAREDNFVSKRQPRGRRSRLSVLDVAVQPVTREARAGHPRVYEMEDAPEPRQAGAATPAIPAQYLNGPEREPFTLVDDSSQRRVLSNQLGSHSAAEKVSAYLSQLPSFDQSSFADDDAPAEQGTEAAGGAGRISRRPSNASSMHTSQSRPMSMEGTMFHDAFVDAED